MDSQLSQILRQFKKKVKEWLHVRLNIIILM